MQSSDKRIQFCIGGMTCINCQNKIEKVLKHTEGILRASVSYSKGTADIAYDEKRITLDEIVTVIENLEYQVILEKKQQETELLDLVCILVIIVALYVMLQSMGILNLLVPSQLADTKMGYGMLFVIGLLTSVHCIAMCGGINLSQCISKEQQKRIESGSKWAVFHSALFYNFGRVLSYTMIGFVCGLIGLFISTDIEAGFSIYLQGVLKMIAGLFMVIIGLNLLGIFPWLHKFTVRMPRCLVRKIGEEKQKSNRPFIVGILNGFMPCGPLQSMWIVALVTGNPFVGALSMLLFSLGTVPLMLGLSSIVTVLGRKFTNQVMMAGAVLIVVLGLAMLSQGGSLSGWLPPDLLLILIITFFIIGVLFSIPNQDHRQRNILKIVSLVIIIGSYILWNFQGVLIKDDSMSDSTTKMVDGMQIVNSTLGPGNYPDIEVQVGVPVKWTIEAPKGTVNGCNYKIEILDYGIEHTFHTGENVIEFTPTKAGTIRYRCWMGMIHGNINVKNETGKL
ncbi:MAG: sulfite exporter TauE/SafE family protein [Lachnospiraceae bacterium]|nr:sulfite exporter TauE/SafE family protein [Lachnospiraceae bacterium]